MIERPLIAVESGNDLVRVQVARALTNILPRPRETLAAIRSAVTSTTVGNWQPLTMLSLELDRSLFGNGPAGFHRTNLFLHAASACLLFLVLSHMTRKLWPAAAVAALFALHPLHVES